MRQGAQLSPFKYILPGIRFVWLCSHVIVFCEKGSRSKQEWIVLVIDRAQMVAGVSLESICIIRLVQNIVLL